MYSRIEFIINIAYFYTKYHLFMLYYVTTIEPPVMADYKKSPRLHILDTGLVNYFTGLQKELFSTRDLNSVYEGGIAEHIVWQELLAES